MKHRESDIQKSCVRWFRLVYPNIGKLLFAVPNGGSRNKIEAAIMKAEGITAGVSDLILLYGNGKYNSLCIEMKTETGRLSENQKTWLKLASKNGSKCIVCRSLDSFMKAVTDYLKGG